MIDHRREIEALGAKITDLSDALAKLGEPGDFQRLIHIIKHPGWTTPAELAFAMAIVEHMATQAHGLNNLKGQLLQASGEVGQKQTA